MLISMTYVTVLFVKMEFRYLKLLTTENITVHSVFELNPLNTLPRTSTTESSEISTSQFSEITGISLFCQLAR